MKVIGTAAATAQLLGMVIKILESIGQLQDLIQHMPSRYRSWDTELIILRDAIVCVQRDSTLHTIQVKRIIEHMGPKIKSLVSSVGRTPLGPV